MAGSGGDAVKVKEAMGHADLELQNLHPRFESGRRLS